MTQSNCEVNYCESLVGALSFLKAYVMGEIVGENKVYHSVKTWWPRGRNNNHMMGKGKNNVCVILSVQKIASDQNSKSPPPSIIKWTVPYTCTFFVLLCDHIGHSKNTCSPEHVVREGLMFKKSLNVESCAPSFLTDPLNQLI